MRSRLQRQAVVVVAAVVLLIGGTGAVRADTAFDLTVDPVKVWTPTADFRCHLSIYTAYDGYTTAAAYSPHPNVYGSGGSSSSMQFADWQEWADNVLGTWTLIMDEGLATEHVFTFELQVNPALMNASTFPDFGIDSPAAASTVGVRPTFEYHGPGLGGWTCLRDEDPWDGVFDEYFVETDTVHTHTLTSDLTPGPYYLQAWSNVDLTPDQMWTTTPVDAAGNPLPGWIPLFHIQEMAQSYFTVTPEPATLALLAVGGLMTLARRRRR